MKKIRYCSKDIGVDGYNPESLYSALDKIYEMMHDIGIKQREYHGFEADKNVQIWEIPDSGCIIFEEECNGFSFEVSFDLIGFDENSPKYQDVVNRIRSFERKYE